MCGWKLYIHTAIVIKINAFIRQAITESDIAEHSVVGRACKQSKVVLASTNMSSSILQRARLNHSTNVYINEYLTQKRSNFLTSRKIIPQLVQCTAEMFQFITSSNLIKIN